MAYFRVTALGCKVNQYEAQAIGQTLRQAGLAEWSGEGAVDLCVVHSCCITAEAARKSRQLLRRRLREHPEAALLLSGCAAIAGELDGAIPAVRWQVGRGDDLAAVLRRAAAELLADAQAEPILGRNRRPGLLEPPRPPQVKVFRHEQASSQRPRAATNASAARNGDCPAEAGDESPARDPKPERPSTYASNLSSIKRFAGRTRAFVKVQDGCDRFCSYCIIPHLRDRLNSRSGDEILSEISDLLDNGYREIILCGINLGAYGHASVKARDADEPAAPLAALLDRVARLIGPRGRVRISSLDPSDIATGLAHTLADNSNICPHLHLSLQSGSDAILDAMGRAYDSAGFMRAVDLLNSALQRPAITTDVIVGFPGETEADFQATLELVERAGLSRVHVFPYSPRPGTAAAASAAARPEAETVRRRCRRLAELADDLAARYAASLGGLKARVLIENVTNGKCWGYCQRYTRIALESPTAAPGDFLDATYT